MSRLEEEAILSKWFESRGFEVVICDDAFDLLMTEWDGVTLVATDSAESSRTTKELAPGVSVILIQDEEGDMEQYRWSHADYRATLAQIAGND